MRAKAFADWLMNVDHRDIRQARDYVSRVRRVENALSEYLLRSVNLDEEFNNDNCDFILSLLSIEHDKKISNTINLPESKDGLSKLKTAVNKYIRFCNALKQE
ncbi:hypothetical protein SAMN05446037_102511 [Anaerovirgula multivorans]|uniref:Uncharacterized protein n=1 Tax=Anaerovirgula multivorans TaxID=312168 RepID=A0A239I1H6_9FIRM|nr:hypothetical protein [Anaerovirgula multivorans]SNS87379.1 hypothetical protein SAMN05446037_102511 [Anaerovirgula multivorans]